MVKRDVSWKRVGVAAAATFVSLYALAFSIGLASEGAETPGGSIGWLIVFAIVSNTVWWGILLYPRPAK
ncbi:MAG TPA: hypothetical protein VGA48_02610 [Thermoplasmata archaeon]